MITGTLKNKVDAIRQTEWAHAQAWAPDCIERNGKYNLYNGRLNILPTSVEQIHDVSKAECQGRYDDCCFQIVLLHRTK